MSCYHPMTGIPTGDVWPSGKKKFRFVNIGPEGLLTLKNEYPDAILVPCGKCFGCRLDYARHWSDRMQMEYETNKRAAFITLTYSEENIPLLIDEKSGEVIEYTLRKEDIQCFMKRLRRRYDGHDGNENIRIRFFASGEYGSKTHRPHYHAILFGVDIYDLGMYQVQGHNDLGQMYYKCRVLEELWPYGFSLACEVSYETCNYVARYVTKKATSEYSPADLGAVPEFSLMSRKPALGTEYIKLHPEVIKYREIQLADGRKASVPRIFRDKYFDDDSNLDMRMQNKAESVWNTKHHLEESRLSVLDSLVVSEETRKQKLKSLKRDKI